MINNIKWINANIIKINKWKNNLFSIILNSNIDKFIPGQFTRIKIKYSNKYYIRAYSYINSVYDKNLELYIKKINNGIVSNFLFNLSINDKILITKKSYGLLIINNIICKNLWMISTGTGIGPFISILSSNCYFSKIKKIILIYSVKYYDEFNYENKLKNIKNNIKNKFFLIKIISREKNNIFLNGGVSKLIINESIENKIFTKINNEKDCFMLCGNPKMIDDVKKNLQLYKNIKEEKIIFEKYWKK